MNTTPSEPISLYWRKLRHLLAEQRYPCGHRSKPRRHRDTSSAAIDAGGLCLPGPPSRHHDRRGCHRRRLRVGVFLRPDRAALPASWNLPERMAAATLRLGRWGAGAADRAQSRTGKGLRPSRAAEFLELAKPATSGGDPRVPHLLVIEAKAR